MKTYKKLLLGMLFLSSAFVVGACNNSKNNSDDSSSSDENQQVLKYTVTFNTNGGSEISSQEIEKDGKASQPTAPSKAADAAGTYTFAGWYKDEALTQAFNFANDTITSDITLYAKWNATAKEYTVTFVSNGGTEVAAQTLAYGSSVTQPTNPTKEASDVFLGWYKNEALTEEFDFDSETVSDNLTLYAKWRKADPEDAMDNFFTKICAPDYSVEKENFLKVVAHSDNLVYFDYNDESINDMAVMTVNGDDTFVGNYEDNQIGTLNYLNEGTAFEGAKSRLLASWADIVGSNVWDYFYNDPENPVKFISNDESIKRSCLNYTPYGKEFALTKMKEVVVTLDNENPTSAIISFDFDENFQQLVYTEIKVTFGNTTGDEIAEAWMNDPNRTYPEAKTEWGDDEFYLNSVFLLGSGQTALPFPTFATYAFTLDEEAFMNEEKIVIRDSRASYLDVFTYMYETLMTEHGFAYVSYEPHTFRLKLREHDGTSCYSKIIIEMDPDNEGVTITASKCYDNVEYSSLDDINDIIEDKGFFALPEDDNFTDIYAVDRTFEVVESLLYLFNYDLVLNIEIKFSDYDAALEYIEAYASKLENEMNFIPSTQEGSNFHTLTTAQFRKTFDYIINRSTNTLSIAFKNENYISTADALGIIEGMGFPKPELGTLNCNSHKEITNFLKAYYTAEVDYALEFTIDFESINDRDAFLDYYVQTLLDSTFEDISGRSRIGKIYAFYDEENKNIFAFTPKGEDPKVSFVFAKASSDYEPGEEDSYLNSIANQIIEDKMLLADSYFKQSDTYDDNIPWGPFH